MTCRFNGDSTGFQWSFFLSVGFKRSPTPEICSVNVRQDWQEAVIVEGEQEAWV